MFHLATLSTTTWSAVAGIGMVQPVGVIEIPFVVCLWVGTPNRNFPDCWPSVIIVPPDLIATPKGSPFESFYWHCATSVGNVLIMCLFAVALNYGTRFTTDHTELASLSVERMLFEVYLHRVRARGRWWSRAFIHRLWSVCFSGSAVWHTIYFK